jgi:hypothetical protein
MPIPSLALTLRPTTKTSTDTSVSTNTYLGQNQKQRSPPVITKGRRKSGEERSRGERRWMKIAKIGGFDDRGTRFLDSRWRSGSDDLGGARSG